MARQMKAMVPQSGKGDVEKTYEGFDRNFQKPPNCVALVVMGANTVAPFALENTSRQKSLQTYLIENFSGAEIIGVYKKVE